MNHVRHGLLLALLTLPTLAAAQNPCNPKGTDVCAMARHIADDTASMLPIRMNRNLSIQTVFAAGNIVTMTAKYEYDRDFLDKTLAAAGLSDAQMLQIMRGNALGALCATNAPARDFIEHGGIVRYLYRFNDGTTHTTMDIASCQ